MQFAAERTKRQRLWCSCIQLRICRWVFTMTQLFWISLCVKGKQETSRALNEMLPLSTHQGEAFKTMFSGWALLHISLRHQLHYAMVLEFCFCDPANLLCFKVNYVCSIHEIMFPMSQRVTWKKNSCDVWRCYRNNRKIFVGLSNFSEFCQWQLQKIFLPQIHGQGELRSLINIIIIMSVIIIVIIVIIIIIMEMTKENREEKCKHETKFSILRHQIHRSLTFPVLYLLEKSSQPPIKSQYLLRMKPLTWFYMNASVIIRKRRINWMLLLLLGVWYNVTVVC